MAKFNLDSIKNVEGNSTGKKLISISDMIPNRFNEYACEDIELLAEDIKEHGLLQNFVLMENKEEKGKYTIIAGHRRYHAIKMLIENGEMSAENKWESKVIKYTNDELEIKLALVVANSYRDKSEQEKYNEYLIRKAIIERDEAKGIKVEGRKRLYLAKEMGVSAGKIQSMEDIDKKAIPEVKEVFQNGKISSNVASQISKLPEEEQKEIISKTTDNKSAKALLDENAKKKEVKKQETENVAKPTPSENKTEREVESETVVSELEEVLEDNEAVEKKTELTKDDFIKIVNWSFDKYAKTLNGDVVVVNQLNAIRKSLTNLLSKDIDTILDIIS